jgi:hypothetical protein
MRAMVLAAMSFALFCRVLTPTPAAAQQIVKWTDESGQVHYSDHAPPGATAAKVAVQKAPRAPETDIASPTTAPPVVTSQSDGSGLSPAAEAIHAADEARLLRLLLLRLGSLPANTSGATVLWLGQAGVAWPARSRTAQNTHLPLAHDELGYLAVPNRGAGHARE